MIPSIGEVHGNSEIIEILPRRDYNYHLYVAVVCRECRAHRTIHYHDFAHGMSNCRFCHRMSADKLARETAQREARAARSEISRDKSERYRANVANRRAERRARVQSMMESGMKNGEIAKALNVSPGLITKIGKGER